MEFSLTDTQLPMLLRIVKLVLALYYGDLQEKPDTNDKKKDDFTIDMSLAEKDEISDDSKTVEANSWGGWAWNVGSTVGKYFRMNPSNTTENANSITYATYLHDFRLRKMN